MARILLAEDDSVFSALVSDRLHLAGYDVLALSGGDQVLEILKTVPCDLAIVDLDLEALDSVELIKSLRAEAVTESLPILIIANHDEGARRLEALRAGADDALVRPCHFDEAVLRVGRLLGTEVGSGMSLNGDLSGSRLWDTLQYLERSGLGGTVLVRRRSFSGRLHLEKGGITGASFAEVTGPEAVLAMLGLKKGRFRFVVGGRASGHTQSSQPYSLEAILLRAAVLEDELARCHEYLPSTGETLTWTGGPLPGGDGGPLGLPVRQLAELLSESGKGSLYRLFKTMPVAPQKIRLAAAHLVERGMIRRPIGAGRAATTTDVETRHLIGVAIYKLMLTAREAGFAPGVVPFVVLADEQAWPDCVELLADLGDPDDELVRLGKRLRTELGGTADFKVGGDRLALHLQQLTGDQTNGIEPIVDGCAGMMIWVNGRGNRAMVERLVEGLERSPHPATGLLIGSTHESAEWVKSVAASRSRWRWASQPPKTLFGLLRLLRPQTVQVG